MKAIHWIAWITLTLALAVYFGFLLFKAEDKSPLLIGEASHGHFQIELACSSCHLDAFGGGEVIQNACIDCHGDDLEMAHDSHPRKKFTDPRNADLLEIIDARQCISCHTEHQQEQTRAMGVTIPDDYCYHCHQDIGDNRDSHKDLPFDSCASAGCHNYHDNRALYEDFLVEHNDAPWLNAVAALAQPNSASYHAPALTEKVTPASEQWQAVSITKQQQHPQIVAEWLTSRHQQQGVDCVGCHVSKDEWVEKPGLDQCQTCHLGETATYLQGKHGMRLAAGLDAMTPEQSQMDFHPHAANQTQGCSSCHGSHSFDTQKAALESCLSCHADEHSLAYSESPHGQLTQKALNGEQPWNEAVTCATCHMPRLLEKPHGIASNGQPAMDYGSSINAAILAELSKGGEEVRVGVMHNQNLNLRPNEKMIRPVCMSCHSLEFSIDALADDDLIKNNFNGKPSEHIKSINWATKRAVN